MDFNLHTNISGNKMRILIYFILLVVSSEVAIASSLYSTASDHLAMDLAKARPSYLEILSPTLRYGFKPPPFSSSSKPLSPFKLYSSLFTHLSPKQLSSPPREFGSLVINKVAEIHDFDLSRSVSIPPGNRIIRSLACEIERHTSDDGVRGSRRLEKKDPYFGFYVPLNVAGVEEHIVVNPTNEANIIIHTRMIFQLYKQIDIARFTSIGKPWNPLHARKAAYNSAKTWLAYHQNGHRMAEPGDHIRWVGAIKDQRGLGKAVVSAGVTVYPNKVPGHQVVYGLFCHVDINFRNQKLATKVMENILKKIQFYNREHKALFSKVDITNKASLGLHQKMYPLVDKIGAPEREGKRIFQYYKINSALLTERYNEILQCR